jgi:hypothetical protein
MFFCLRFPFVIVVSDIITVSLGLNVVMYGSVEVLVRGDENDTVVASRLDRGIVIMECSVFCCKSGGAKHPKLLSDAVSMRNV